MKKFAAFVTVVALLAVAAPVLAATNPFMDVPMNSWAYDAVAQLASKGIIAGYPDGLFKGRQMMTRYEAASIVARALAYMEMSKATKQDIDMLKRLVIEFKDELDALGVKVDEFGKDMAALKQRLGGWRIGGHIRLDVDYRMRSREFFNKDGNGNFGGIVLEDSPKSMGNIGMSDGRLNIQRFFGEDEKAFFQMRLRFRTDSNGWDNTHRSDLAFSNGNFFVKVPFIFDSFLTAGYGGGDDKDKYFGFYPDRTGRYLDGGGWFNDNDKYLLKLEKSFEYGDFYFSVAHPDNDKNGAYTPSDRAWELFTNINFNWSELLKFGIGGQFLSQNDWTVYDPIWNNIFTGWVGLTFNLTQGVALHGMGYFQTKDSDNTTRYDENANAWRAAIDIKQDFLKFTSLYGEYGRIDQYFFTAQGIGYNGMLLFTDRDAFRGNASAPGQIGWMDINTDDISYWKAGAIQQWTDAWRTWLFYGQANGKTTEGKDTGLRQYAVGIDYVYNPYTIFSLNYLRFDGRDAADGRSYSRARFTTTVNF